VTQDISERVEVERALQDSEERYRDLVENSHDLICTHDLSGCILSTNELPARLLGYRPDELVGRAIPDYLYDGDRDKFWGYIEQIKRDGFAQGLLPLMTNSGKPRVWEFQSTLRTEGVPVPVVRGMAHDVTDLINLQRDLRESTARLRALVSSIDEIAFEFDVEGTVLDIWTTNESQLFRPREQLLGRRMWDVVGEDFAPIYRGAFKRVLESGKGEDLEYSLHINGSEHWFLCRVTPIVAPDGTYKSICMLARDITERKRAQENLHKSEERFRLAAQAGRMYAYEWDVASDVVMRSAECADILGVGEPTRITRQELLRAVHPDDREKCDVGSVTPNNATTHIKYRVVRSDGHVIWVEKTARAFFDEEGKMLRMIGMVVDITECEHAEDAVHEKQATIRGLFHIAQTLTKTLDLNTLLDHLNCQSMTLIGAEGSCAALLHENAFACDSFFDMSGRKRVDLTWPPNVGIPGWVLANKRTYVTNDAAQDLLIIPEAQKALGLRNVLCVPVLGNQEEVIAFFALHNKHEDDFGPSDVERVEGISKFASIAIQNVLAYQRTCRAEEGLRDLSARLINLQDDERCRIAHELHESMAQDLAALRLALEHLARLTRKDNDGVVGIVDETLRLSNGLIQQMRTMSYGLYPPLLEEGGLPLAISLYAHTFSEHSGIKVKVCVDVPRGIGRLPRQTEITLFRIVQQCLTNVHHHSQSHKATIRMSYKDEHLVLEVNDQGKGIATTSGKDNETKTLQGVGIASMRERVKQLHGTFLIESSRGQGATIRVVLPVANKMLR
jgi:PAS domain S-box-containing protein